MHHSTHGNCDGHHWYADFIILCFLMTYFKDLSQAHTITYLKKYNSKIPTFTPSLLNQNIESLNTKCRLQENKLLQKTATTGRQPVDKRKYLMIFFLIPHLIYVLTPFLNRLVETVQIRGHDICFYADLTKIVPNYH